MTRTAKSERLSGLCNLLHARAGATAVEFALILPIMISIYLGTVEMSNGWAAYRQVSLVTGAAASLVAKQSSITTSQMSDYLSASTAIMTPFAATGITVTVSCISVASGKATVSWSSTLNGTARAKGSTVSIPSAFSSKSKIVLNEVTYPYTSIVGYYISTTLPLSWSLYKSPRLTSAPSFNGTAC
jgi:Flp pilus assembly protein TadG